ncbi:Zn-dependent peptidase ImmA (M78 family) [Streptomyces sp. V3I8]|uniref:hypothetical protein n=1 Tax=Streptomyces sp. V3I8 TaxID=3042279 RepID=UPI00278A6573|nr:hypothetical protein [Streptomyces sp. V3I8]MDQ1039910.1 Zn-dependent peptidase ImmA (M78 family) [Streptomyces sp. V3I8]
MNVATHKTSFASSRGSLTALRALAHDSAHSMEDMLRTARAQAILLRSLLTASTYRIPDQLNTLIPSIRVEHVTDIPIAGVSFWARNHWHIHIRSSDPTEIQTATVLHQLKHIIDHPLRQKAARDSPIHWERLADYFTELVLAPDPRRITP